MKRLERDITLRGFAHQLGISPVYMCNIEKDRRNDPADEIVEKMASLLNLNRKEKTEMLDLLAKAKKRPTVAADLPAYINDHEIVRIALRTAKETDASEQEWKDFIERLRNRQEA